jgi:hypothetical protein
MQHFHVEQFGWHHDIIALACLCSSLHKPSVMVSGTQACGFCCAAQMILFMLCLLMCAF